MASRRILVVEDDPRQRRRILSWLGRHLEEKPYLLEAADGRQAIAVALHEKPDLILLDDTLPTLSGTTVCQELKKDPETAPIKIVLLTVWDTKLLDRHQADAYLAKPYNSVELLRMVEWILQQ